MTQVNWKQKRETQKWIFDKLQHLASAKILVLDEFLQVQCDIHYEEFVEKFKGVELFCLLIQGSSTQAPAAGAPSAPRQQVFKPNESFLDQRKKATPWYSVTDTTVSAKDSKSIRDYITSGAHSQMSLFPICIYKKTDVH